MKIPKISAKKVKKHDMTVAESQREVQISQSRENFVKKFFGKGIMKRWEFGVLFFVILNEFILNEFILNYGILPNTEVIQTSSVQQKFNVSESAIWF